MVIMKVIISAMLCLVLAPVCFASVYKYIDADGNTVYSDKKPDDVTEKVEELNVRDSYTNSMESIKPESGNSPVFDEIRANQETRETLEQSRRKAKQEVQKQVSEAEIALEEAKQVRSGDMFPIPSGGVRYSQQYMERIEAAQKKLDDAKDQYKKF